MQKTTAQPQLESQKTRARLVLFWKPFYKKKERLAKTTELLSNNVTNNM